MSHTNNGKIIYNLNTQFVIFYRDLRSYYNDILCIFKNSLIKLNITSTL
jgi:hypothetical protein